VQANPLITKQKAARLMYTIDTQWTHSQQHSEAVTAWDRYSYGNTSATKPLITKQNAARLMYTIDTQQTHS